VVAFGGSGGGLMGASMWAPLLASHGIATLAIAYFGLPGLPAELVGIEVEVVERAAGWLRARPETLMPVGVMGASRGSELALWSAALLDDIASVVAFAPSGVSWSGLGAHGPVDDPAWTFRGKALPFRRIEERPDGRPTEPLALRPIFERALLDRASIDAATIPVEQAQGPILLVSGDADDMWPSAQMAEIVVARASGATSVEHLRYAGAGHTCGGPPGMPSGTSVRHPLDGGFYAFGGSEAANAAARAQAWPRVIDHLRAEANREEEAAMRG
jgi:dienelactone hydrolase